MSEKVRAMLPSKNAVDSLRDIMLDEAPEKSDEEDDEEMNLLGEE